jgi:hypothetical protein
MALPWSSAAVAARDVDLARLAAQLVNARIKRPSLPRAASTVRRQ